MKKTIGVLMTSTMHSTTPSDAQCTTPQEREYTPIGALPCSIYGLRNAMAEEMTAHTLRRTPRLARLFRWNDVETAFRDRITEEMNSVLRKHEAMFQLYGQRTDIIYLPSDTPDIAIAGKRFFHDFNEIFENAGYNYRLEQKPLPPLLAYKKSF
jgi:hypothetical protein